MLIYLLLLFIYEISGFTLAPQRRSLPYPSVSFEMSGLKAVPPRKILLIVEPSPFTYISGYANRFQEMLNHLKLSNDKVVIITTDKNLADAPKDYLGFPIYSLRGFELPMYKHVTCTFDLKGLTGKVINSFQPDLIHVSAPSACVFPAVYWARKYNIPLVISYHTDLVKYAQTYVPLPGSTCLAESLLKSVLGQADLVLATSPQSEKALQALGITRTDVWMKGVNVEKFSPNFYDDEMRNQLSNGNPDLPLLLYVGRLGMEKRLDRLKNILDENPRVRLAIVGQGPAESSLKHLFANYPVHFAGPLTGNALSKAFASADIFVMPSNSETLGFVVLEALASGVPAIGVRAGGLVDIIEEGNTGYLVEDKDDMQEFSEKVRYLTNNPDSRQQLSRNARNWALEWSWSNATSNLRNSQYEIAVSIHRARHNHDKSHIDEISGAILQYYLLNRTSKHSEETKVTDEEDTNLLPFDDDNY